MAEEPDHTLRLFGLPDAEALEEDFWAALGDPGLIHNLHLTRSNVYIQREEGKDILVIEVPPAPGERRPVYLGDDPFQGTYIRRRDGDYRCTRREVPVSYTHLDVYKRQAYMTAIRSATLATTPRSWVI